MGKGLLTKNMKRLRCSIFCLSCLQESQVVEIIKEVWSKKDYYLLKEDEDREHFNNLDMHKPIGAERMCP